MGTIKCLTQIKPLFVSIPWHLKGPYDVTRIEPLLAAKTLKKNGLEVLLHIAATGLKKEHVFEILTLAKKANIRNIFALRGDRTKDSPPSDFSNACDLVRFIQRHFTNQFTICVGGYPNGHPENPSYLDDLKFLKEKVDAGADFIITQILFDAQDFLKFENDCRKIGIKVPIIPGIMPIQNRQSLETIMKICQVKIPIEILTKVKSMDDDKIVTNYGILKAVELIKEILESGVSVKAVHCFTMNRFQMSLAVKKEIECIQRKSIGFSNFT